MGDENENEIFTLMLFLGNFGKLGLWALGRVYRVVWGNRFLSNFRNNDGWYLSTLLFRAHWEDDNAIFSCFLQVIFYAIFLLWYQVELLFYCFIKFFSLSCYRFSGSLHAFFERFLQLWLWSIHFLTILPDIRQFITNNFYGVHQLRILASHY